MSGASGFSVRILAYSSAIRMSGSNRTDFSASRCTALRLRSRHSGEDFNTPKRSSPRIGSGRNRLPAVSSGGGVGRLGLKRSTAADASLARLASGIRRGRLGEDTAQFLGGLVGKTGAQRHPTASLVRPRVDGDSQPFMVANAFEGFGKSQNSILCVIFCRYDFRHLTSDSSTRATEERIVAAQLSKRIRRAFCSLSWSAELGGSLGSIVHRCITTGRRANPRSRSRRERATHPPTSRQAPVR